MPYLCDENDKLIKLNGTLREAGTNPKSKFFVDFNLTGKECEIDVDAFKSKLHFKNAKDLFNANNMQMGTDSIYSHWWILEF